MGTRHLTCVFYKNEYKVAQYGQWDGYPGGQGVTILKFLESFKLDKFKKELEKIRFLTDAEYNEIIEKYTGDKLYWKHDLKHLSRDTGASILNEIALGNIKTLKNSLSFAGDSLFCEWAYIIDLDKNTLEVYEGFNKKPLEKNDRFYGLENVKSSDDYYPIKLLHSFDLNNLPNEQSFISTLEPPEVDE